MPLTMILNIQATLECQANWQKSCDANAAEKVPADTPNEQKWGNNPQMCRLINVRTQEV